MSRWICRYNETLSTYSDTPSASITIEATFPLISPGPETTAVFYKIKATLENKGARLDDLDLIIGAIALTRNLTLVTNNQNHFSRIQGLKLANWAQ